MEPRYYLALFNPQSWIEFLEKGSSVYGTTKNKLNRAKKVHQGDFLICYISKQSVFSGVLRVNSEVYYDDSEYWAGGVFPVRFNVQPENIVSLENAIQISDVKQNLKIFSNLKRDSNWAGFFINAFNEFPKDDAIYLINSLKQLLSRKSKSNSI